VPPAYSLMKAHSVADVWREWKEGIAGRPPVEELERAWGARWRPGHQMRMAWCRRKVVLDEITRLIQSGLDPTLAVQHLETQRQRNRQTLPSLIRALQAERRQLAKE
jgi:Transcriptional activator of glycolytic enzymes